ncbi:hypothetical protein LCGC14_0405780 [marine sediment metagenome]|uniref:Uncharacterized protein n=1 Tax=marine sediment metagenome TaxID=412755 RepID=A0A0F9T0V7_9ZZZZ
MEWYEILSLVVVICGAVLGGNFYRKWKQVVNLLLELGEAFTKTGEALEDKKITKAEAVELLEEWMDVFNAVMLLLPKSIAKKLNP